MVPAKLKDIWKQNIHNIKISKWIKKGFRENENNLIGFCSSKKLEKHCPEEQYGSSYSIVKCHIVINNI